ncbi:MAG: molybdate ABC transporter permease subunit [Solirubrobacterales bacterium]|nr:molybdate ABC transporter permease subunit [Solirubrobacterales bacterium]
MSPFRLASLLALAVLLSFLAIPIVAIFVEAGPRELVDSLGREGSLEALWLSLRTSLVAVVAILVVGTPAAFLLARRSFRGRAALITVIELPLVLPPAAAGIALLAAFGPQGLVGGAIEDAGVQLVLQTAGVVVAMTFVAAPFYVRGAMAAFEAIDPDLLDASRTLGAGEGRTFARIAIPGARAGLVSGLALAWGRALGEFGATLLFAGSLEGRTQTAPLAIFRFLASDFDASLALSGVLVLFSAALLLGVKFLGGTPEASRAAR